MEHASSPFRVEKRRADAQPTLATGARVHGCFFLAEAAQSHNGPERIADLLNEHTAFFPFDRDDGCTALYNRAQIVKVRLPAEKREVQLEPGYEVATRRYVSMLLSTGERITGAIAVYCPAGRDRLSDYARREQLFRYVETDEHTWIVNSAHMVELTEIGD